MKSLANKIVLSLFTAALSTFAVQEAQAQQAQWQNVVNLNLGYGTTYTMWTPTAVLRPHKGDLLRLSVPMSCGAVQIYQLGAWGKLTNGLRTVLSANLVGTEADLLSGMNRWTYQVNGGTPATVYELGLYALTNSLFGCQITFEQANTAAPALPAGCDFGTVCTAHVDNTFACVAYGAGSTTPAYVEWANVGSDNACNVSIGLKTQICAQNRSPDAYTIECVEQN